MAWGRYIYTPYYDRFKQYTIIKDCGQMTTISCECALREDY
jgi:hypothetical protein